VIDFAGMEARTLAVQALSPATPLTLGVKTLADSAGDVPVLLHERLRAVLRLRELEQEARDELARLTRDVDFAPTPDLIALEARAIAFNAAVDVVLGVVA
jgi:hypothetical protein